MRKKLILALGLVAVLSAGFATAAFAKWTVLKAGTIEMKVDGGTIPKALPKKTMAPIKVRVRGEISDSGRADGHPAAFRIADIDFDKNGVVDATGLAVCKKGQLQSQPTPAAMKLCGKSLVGEGTGQVQISFAEQPPIPVTAPIKAFNGGVKGGKITLFIHTFITVPVPAAVVTEVTIKKIKKGRYGINTLSKIPEIAGGNGAVLSFDIKFGKNYNYKGKKRAYIKAKCTDGKFHAQVNKVEFRDEVARLEERPETRTNLKGTVIRPCTPKG